MPIKTKQARLYTESFLCTKAVFTYKPHQQVETMWVTPKHVTAFNEQMHGWSMGHMQCTACDQRV